MNRCSECHAELEPDHEDFCRECCPQEYEDEPLEEMADKKDRDDASDHYYEKEKGV